MANVSINFEIPCFDPTSENVERVKTLLLYALRDMVINNGHLIDESRDYALARLVVGRVSCGLDENLEDAERECAKDAEVL